MQVYDVTSFLALHPGGGQLVVDAAAQAWSCKPDVNTLQKDMICVYIYINYIYHYIYIVHIGYSLSFFVCTRHFGVTFVSTGFYFTL